MKKATANEVYDRLRDIDLGSWNVQPPEYNQRVRSITYRVRLTHRSDGESSFIPIPTFTIMKAIDQLDIERISTSLHHITSEDQEDDYGSDGYVRDEIPRFEFIISNYESDELPRTPEEERIVRMGRDLSNALDLPNSVDSKKLAEKFETVGELLEASEEELRSITGVGPKTVDIILQKRSPEVNRRLDELGKGGNHTVLVVEKNEQGTYIPVFEYDTIEGISRDLRDSL